jgi:ABC-type transport system involved in cytochrome bd biosynthesis fused ATPase/permease subunit
MSEVVEVVGLLLQDKRLLLQGLGVMAEMAQRLQSLALRLLMPAVGVVVEIHVRQIRLEVLEVLVAVQMAAALRELLVHPLRLILVVVAVVAMDLFPPLLQQQVAQAAPALSSSSTPYLILLVL